MASKVYFTDMHATMRANLQKKLEILMKKTGFEKIDFSGKFVAVKLSAPQLRENRLRLHKEIGRQTLCDGLQYPLCRRKEKRT